MAQLKWPRLWASKDPKVVHFWLQTATLVSINFCQGVMLTTPFTLSVYMVRRFEQARLAPGEPVDEQRVGRLTGLLAGSFSMASFVTSMLWGMASNIMGRKPVLIIGLAVSVISMIWYGLATSYAWAVAARAFGGFFNGVLGAWKCLIGESGDSLVQGKMFGFMSLAWGLGTTIGPIIGGSLAQPCDHIATMGWCQPGQIFYERPFFLACLVGSITILMSALATQFILDETLPDATRQRQIAVWRERAARIRAWAAGRRLSTGGLGSSGYGLVQEHTLDGKEGAERGSEEAGVGCGSSPDSPGGGGGGKGDGGVRKALSEPCAEGGGDSEVLPLLGKHEALAGVDNLSGGRVCRSISMELVMVGGGQEVTRKVAKPHAPAEQYNASEEQPLLVRPSSADRHELQAQLPVVEGREKHELLGLSRAGQFPVSEAALGGSGFDEALREVTLEGQPLLQATPHDLQLDQQPVAQDATTQQMDLAAHGAQLSEGHPLLSDSRSSEPLNQIHNAQTAKPAVRFAPPHLAVRVDNDEQDFPSPLQGPFGLADGTAQRSLSAPGHELDSPTDHAWTPASPDGGQPSRSMLVRSRSSMRMDSMRSRMNHFMRLGSRVYFASPLAPFRRGNAEESRSLITPRAALSHGDGLPVTARHTAAASEGEVKAGGQEAVRGEIVVWHRNRQVLLTICAYGFCSFLYCAMDELIPIFGAAPIESGGLGLEPAQLAPPITVFGITLMVYSAFVYPAQQKVVGTLRLARFGLLAAIVVCLMLPLAHSLLNANKVLSNVVLYGAMVLKSFAQCAAFTGALVMVNAAPHQSQLGEVNGVGQTVAALVRGLGPALGGVLWAASLALHSSGQQFVPFVCVALLAVASFLVYGRVHLPNLS